VTGTPPRRVIVGLDSSRPSLVAAAAAAEVAAVLDAELLALYVEDLDLLRLAEAPLAMVVDWLSAHGRPLATSELEHEMRAQATRARAEIERLVAGKALRWSFRVARGPVAKELLTAAEASDLVVVGRVGAGGRSEPLGHVARAVAVGRGGAMLMLGTGREADAAVLARLRAELGVEIIPLLLAGAALAERLRNRIESSAMPVLLVD
jgi:nucleotide-binding universal stress UspA family protein